MLKKEVTELFADHEGALKQYFKFYCNLGTKELGYDLTQKLQNLHFKEFSKLSYQSKIVPIIMTVEDIQSTFKNMIRQFQMNKLEATESVKGTSRTLTSEDGKDAINSNYMNYETFKKTLVRLSIIGCEYLGGQDAEGVRKLEELNRKRE